MGSLEKRLKVLENRSAPEVKRKVHIPRSMERYFHALDNARRQEYGLEPLPDLEYTEEDYEDGLITLNEHIPTMRSSPGWQTEEGRVFLNKWERDTKERIERFEHDRRK